MARFSMITLGLVAAAFAALPATAQDIPVSAVALSEMAAQDPQVDYEYPEIVVGGITDPETAKAEAASDDALVELPVAYEDAAVEAKTPTR